MTEADLIQAQFDTGDKVAFRTRGGERLAGTIEKFNRKTATVRTGQSSWRVPYRLLEASDGPLREGKPERLLAVAREARQLMDKHGLQDWAFRFSATRRALGTCKEKAKIIQLGRRHAANDPPEQVTDTILHEIAHALAGAAAGHGPAWRKVAKSLGATPRASRASDPAKDQAVRDSLRPGATLSFRSGNGPRRTGKVVKLNRKTARVSSDGRMLLVPYSCVLPPETAQLEIEF